MQDYRRSADKQRLFTDFNAGRIRILIGSSDTMGTGVNVQLRLKALHHLDVPWLPSQIEQREGRIERQGNQHDEIEVYAYATLGSMDATMWQNNERKARFIAAALSGDRSIRTLEDAGSQANQFALAKAIASGDSRLIQKAGLAGEIARLERQRAAHFDDQLNVRRQIANARSDIAAAQSRLTGIARDLMRRTPTRGDAFTMTLEDRVVSDRRIAGTLLLSKVRLAERARRGGKHTLGAIGGFDLVCHARRTFPNGFEATLIVKRSGYDHELAVDPEQTPMGLIARLEHALERFEAEREEHTRREQDASARLEGYEARLGEPFPWQSELDDKLARMAQLEAELAGKSGGTADPQPFAA
jgi:hypothetical protein